MNPKPFPRPEVIGKFELLFPRKHVALPFDVERFEEGTVDFGAPLGERLRWLAIWAEGMVEWSVLETLYSHAQGSDEACADILHSWGLAALHEAWRADSEDDRRELISKAREVIGQGIELDPGDSGLYCLMGRVLCHDRSMPKEEAIDRFREALSIDPDSFLARMFLAHCLQDLGCWEEALDEFRKIDPDTAKDDYEDPTSVLLKLEEHMGHCLTKLGRLDDAIYKVHMADFCPL